MCQAVRGKRRLGYGASGLKDSNYTSLGHPQWRLRNEWQTHPSFPEVLTDVVGWLNQYLSGSR